MFQSTLYTARSTPYTELTATTWNVERKPVWLQFDHSELRYGLNAALEWDALVPYNGLVQIAEDSPDSLRQPYTLSMFHQLHCLNSLRHQYLLPREERNVRAIHHCMNYIRQMILCRGDMHSEPFMADGTDRPSVETHGTYRCRDFRAVYAAVEENHEQFRLWESETSRQTEYSL